MIRIARKETITARCVALPTPVAPSDAPIPSQKETSPTSTPNTAALAMPTKRSLSAAIHSALDMNCPKSTLSCVAPTMPPPMVPMMQQ